MLCFFFRLLFVCSFLFLVFVFLFQDFFFHIPNACLKILNCIWNIALPLSLALWLFKRRGRDSSAEMLLLAFSDFRSNFCVCDLFFLCISSFPTWRVLWPPPLCAFFYGWCWGGRACLVSLSFLWDLSFFSYSLLPLHFRVPKSTSPFLSLSLVCPEKLCFSKAAVCVQPLLSSLVF